MLRDTAVNGLEGETRRIGNLDLSDNELQLAGLLIVGLQRLGLLMVDRKSFKNGLGCIVLTLNECFTALIANAVFRRLFVIKVIARTASGTYTSATQTGCDCIYCILFMFS